MLNIVVEVGVELKVYVFPMFFVLEKVLVPPCYDPIQDCYIVIDHSLLKGMLYIDILVIIPNVITLLEVFV